MKILSFFKRATLVLFLFLVTFSLTAANSPEEELKLTRKLLYETGKVLVSNNNRTVLDEIYLLEWYEDISLINSEYIRNFRDDIEQFRSLDVKRERLEYLHNQKNSMAIASLVPNAISVATMAFASGNPKQAVIAVAGTALSSITNYLTAKEMAELEKIQSQWDIDDQASQAFNNLNNSIFSNLTALSAEYGFSRDDYASIQTIQSFIKFVQDPNTTPQDIILKCVGTNFEKELNQFSDYWRIVASAYYELGYYEGALDAIVHYEECYEKVFYHDPNYAQILMIKAYCIEELAYDKKEIVDDLISIADGIIANVSVEGDWVEKYYCYLLYLDIANYTNDTAYLEKAFDVLGDVFYINIESYSKDLDDYLSYNFVEEIISGLNQSIASLENEVSIKAEEKNGAKTRERRNIIEAEIKSLNDEKDEYKNNIEAQKDLAKKTLPPSEYLLISLAYEYSSLADELDLTESVDFVETMSKFRNAIQDEFARTVFCGEAAKIYNLAVNYKYNYKVLGLGNPVDVMTFDVPLSYFTFINSDISDMVISIFDAKKTIKIEIPYNENQYETGWDYEIVRTDLDNYNMDNTVVRISVHFEEPLVALEKNEAIPSLFLSFSGTNVQLERIFNLEILTPKDFEKGFFNRK